MWVRKSKIGKGERKRSSKRVSTWIRNGNERKVRVEEKELVR